MEKIELKEFIIDDRGNGIFRINRQAFTDPEILDVERREIFDRTWLYAAHVSEVAKPGAFVTRRVGGRPVIVTCDASGKPHVFLNSCPHRGNLVCLEKSGSARALTCFYHAWSFDLSGKLLGVPDAEAYTPAFKREEMGLKSVPRMENYRGMIFISYDAGIESLESYLGNAREYLDYMIDFGGDEVEIVQGAQAYSMKANWKLLVENSMDGYHALSTHHRYFHQYLPDIGMDPAAWAGANRTMGRGVSLGGGHAMVESPQRPTPLTSSAKVELDAIRARLVEKHGPDRAHRIADYTRNLFIFPNLILISLWHTVRTFYPLRPDYMEVDAWALFPKNDSQQLRQKRMDNFLSFLGPGGFATPDDVSGLEGCQRGFATMRELPWSDISRGMGREEPSSQDELQMRAFWRRWDALMHGRRGPSDCADRPERRLAAE
ncbi:MAG: Rieske 2Fe-2S domain-containing protein [Rhodospirillales bacterium]|nr:Rieske 2Fe-2S domain-containing protein [Rhodospirillales bacterium]